MPRDRGGFWGAGGVMVDKATIASSPSLPQCHSAPFPGPPTRSRSPPPAPGLPANDERTRSVRLHKRPPAYTYLPRSRCCCGFAASTCSSPPPLPPSFLTCRQAAAVQQQQHRGRDVTGLCSAAGVREVLKYSEQAPPLRLS